LGSTLDKKKVFPVFPNSVPFTSKGTKKKEMKKMVGEEKSILYLNKKMMLGHWSLVMLS
jgi:hypothetical protein